MPSAPLPACSLTPTPNPSVFTARPGLLAIEVVTKTGNIAFVPSESNCFMLDTKRPAGEFVKAMQAEKVYVGRVWPAWPTYTRITIGTPAEMAKFQTALLKVMA